MEQGDNVSNKKSGGGGFCPRALKEFKCEIAKLQNVVCKKPIIVKEQESSLNNVSFWKGIPVEL